MRSNADFKVEVLYNFGIYRVCYYNGSFEYLF